MISKWLYRLVLAIASLGLGGCVLEPYSPYYGYDTYDQGYWYYPSVGVYYDNSLGYYHYYSDDNWVSSRVLPSYLYDGLGPYIVLNDPGPTPWYHYHQHQRDYPPERYRHYPSKPPPPRPWHDRDYHDKGYPPPPPGGRPPFPPGQPPASPGMNLPHAPVEKPFSTDSRPFPWEAPPFRGFAPSPSVEPRPFGGAPPPPRGEPPDAGLPLWLGNPPPGSRTTPPPRPSPHLNSDLAPPPAESPPDRFRSDRFKGGYHPVPEARSPVADTSPFFPAGRPAGPTEPDFKRIQPPSRPEPKPFIQHQDRTPVAEARSGPARPPGGADLERGRWQAKPPKPTAEARTPPSRETDSSGGVGQPWRPGGRDFDSRRFGTFGND